MSKDKMPKSGKVGSRTTKPHGGSKAWRDARRDELPTFFPEEAERRAKQFEDRDKK